SLRYSPLRASKIKKTTSILQLRPDSLQKVDRLISVDPVKDRRERVENESHRRILSLGYERSDLNVELGEIRRVPKSAFSLPRKPRITVDDPQRSEEHTSELQSR